jgi:hypothetical protein
MGTFGRLTADQLDLNIDTFDFTQSLSDTLGDLGTSKDGFDSYVADTIVSIAATGNPGDSMIDDLNLAASVSSSIDPNSLQADAASLPATLAAGDAILADAGALAGGVAEPAPPGAAPPSAQTQSNCSARTNQYGLSTPGTFPGVRVDARDTFQVLRVQDGPCTYSQAQYPSTGNTSFPRIASFTLTSGDPTVWRLGHHQERASDGTLLDLYDVQITPKLLAAQPRPQIVTPNLAGAPPAPPAQSKSHFDAVGVLVMTSPNRTLNVCMSVDCIA